MKHFGAANIISTEFTETYKAPHNSSDPNYKSGGQGYFGKCPVCNWVKDIISTESSITSNMCANSYAGHEWPYPYLVVCEDPKPSDIGSPYHTAGTDYKIAIDACATSDDEYSNDLGYIVKDSWTHVKIDQKLSDFNYDSASRMGIDGTVFSPWQAEYRTLQYRMTVDDGVYHKEADFPAMSYSYRLGEFFTGSSAPFKDFIIQRPTTITLSVYYAT
ncbi:MAG: hypothetical protein J6U54_05655 [Clostridiales bacterium]|nr:hypothetical protein [Clostridiales bacterium]